MSQKVYFAIQVFGLSLLFVPMPIVGWGQDVNPILLQPDLRGEKIVFVANGDVWATSEGENWVARNLTQSTGGENNPKISHDGQWVAYNHAVDGVFVVPFAGGTPKQLTFKGNGVAVFGWTVDGRIAYAGNESAPFPDSTGLSFVRPTGGQPQHTGIAEIGYAWFDPNGVDMIYSKSPVATGNGAKFHGGKANEILRFNWQSGKSENLFPSKWSRNAAVTFKGDAYFVGTEGESALNLWKINSAGASKLTDFTIDGVRNLCCDGTRLILEKSGSLYWFESQNNELKRIPVTFADLSEHSTTASFVVENLVTEVEPTTDGSAVAVVARGEVFVFEKGRLQNISDHSGANDTSIAWSKDGKNLAYISDRTREHAIYIWNPVSRQSRLLATCSRMPVWMEWSPLGDGLYYLLDREAVHWVDAKSGEDQEVASVSRWVTSHSASPDGRYLAITAALENHLTQVVLIDRKTRQSYRVTDPRYVDTSCAFDSQQSSLYFLSRRNGRPNLTNEFPDLNLTGGMSLARIDLSDSNNISAKTDFRKLTKWIETENKDVDSLSGHPEGVAVSGTDGHFFLNRASMRLEKLSDESGGKNYPSQFGSSRARIEQGKLITESWQGSWKPNATFSLAGSFEIDVRQEWESMFWFVHRFHRDQFYDREMLGVDWKAVGDHYAQQLPRIQSREDLSILMSRMTGELPGGHNGVGSPPVSEPIPKRPEAPETGMIVGWDGAGAKILRVLRGRTDMQMFGSLESGVDGKVVEGQYIRSVNGKAVTATIGFDALTLGIKPTDIVTLEVSDTSEGQVKKVEVRFLDNYLGYTDFLDRTIDRVAELSKGRIGYAHIFDTFSQGGGTFADGFYSQWHLDGFILDARWNRGGNANPGFIDALQAKPLFTEVKKFGEPSSDTPTMTGPIVLLVNRETVSGGDLLACAFKSRKVGTLVGDRTSGRTIGNQWYGQMIDGSVVRTSESHNLDWSSGRDAGENQGIQPDVEVELVPSPEFSVDDQQLERAVEILLSKLANNNNTK